MLGSHTRLSYSDNIIASGIPYRAFHLREYYAERLEFIVWSLFAAAKILWSRIGVPGIGFRIDQKERATS